MLPKILASLTHWLIVILIFLVPLFFLPVFPDWFDFPKTLFLLLGLTLLFILSLVSFVIAGNPVIARSEATRQSSSLFLPLSLLFYSAVILVSSFLSINRLDSLITILPLLLPPLLYFLIVSNTLKEKRTVCLTALFLSASVLSLLSLFQFLLQTKTANCDKGVLGCQVLTYGFSPTGSVFTQALFLSGVLFFGVAEAVKQFKNRIKISFFYLLPLVLISLGLSVNLLFLKSFPPIFLNHTSSWRIAASSLAIDPKHAFLGTGPGNFLSAFTRFKPLEFNNNPYWNLRFNAGSNWFFDLLTTAGLLGLSSYLFFIWQIFRHSGDFKIPVLFFLQLLFPSPFVFLFGLFTLSALTEPKQTSVIPLSPPSPSPSSSSSSIFHFLSSIFHSLSTPIFYLLFSIVCALFLLFFSRFALGEFYYNKALLFFSQNKGKDSYEFTRKAIGISSSRDVYHLFASQLNLALANDLAIKKNLTDEEKQTILTLVQQAIAEGRLVISLSPQKVGSYENLAVIYQNLIGFAQGAEAWTIASLNSAITLDPLSPRLPLSAGGVFFNLNDFANASRYFQNAVNLKPNFANAYYNLSWALKNLAEQAKTANNLSLSSAYYGQAILAMETVKNLICQTRQSPLTSPTIDENCQKVSLELDNLKKDLSLYQPPSPVSPAPASLPAQAGLPAESAGHFPLPTSSSATPSAAFQEPLSSPSTPSSQLPKLTPPPLIGTKSGELTR